MDFTEMDISAITSGVNSDGVRYIQLFLQEYTKIFHETVNPGCSKCLTSYLTKYKNHFNMKKSNENSGGFKLHPKYEGMPLEFGSPIMVTNANITPEYAKIILARKDGDRYFETVGETTKAKSDAPVVTLDTLEADLKKAEDDLASLPEKAHHKKKESAENKVSKAREAIETFKAANIEVTEETPE